VTESTADGMSGGAAALDPDREAMLAHYREQDEGGRLTRTGHGRLELARTRELLARLLPPAPARVLDIGGGTGVYAAWLAAAGYDVHLIDSFDEHVSTARRHGTFTAAEGDARHLDEPDGSADAALLLGPLYHLTSPSDRLAALREAHRAVRPGGVVCAAAIGRYMALLNWTSSGGLTDEIAAKLRPVIATGTHDYSLGFAPAHFHLPDELADEVRSAGFDHVRVLGIEGPAWIAVDAAGSDSGTEPVDGAGSDREATLMASALRCARMVEDDPALVSASAHLLAVGRRP
jgi:SAM-dependent methyltransferase